MTRETTLAALHWRHRVSGLSETETIEVSIPSLAAVRQTRQYRNRIDTGWTLVSVSHRDNSSSFNLLADWS